MRQKSVPVKEPAAQVVKNIRRATRRHCQNSINSPGTGVGPGSTGADMSGPGGSGGPAGQR